jgi:hypothetical protein
MTKTINIQSAGQFAEVLKASKVVVADCEFAIPRESPAVSLLDLYPAKRVGLRCLPLGGRKDGL